MWEFSQTQNAVHAQVSDADNSETGKETIMLKHLLNQVILGRVDNSSIKLRDAVRKRADLVSSLDAQILYDIGESDYRRLHRRSAGWDQSRYRLLIDTIANHVGE
jgi:hypothetical protein